MTEKAPGKPIPGALSLSKGMRAALAAALIAAALACAAGLWYVKTADPEGPSLFPPCVFRAITGYYCTGCGITRALHHILNGRVWQGLRMNPLAVLGLPPLIWYMGLIAARILRNRPLPGMPLWMPWVIIGVIVFYTVARNLPWEPFSWLAPAVTG